MQVNAKVQVGPMFVQLANAARALTKSQVSTVLEADMQFKVRSKVSVVVTWCWGDAGWE